ncbi:hypothetical protein [Bacillus sp. V5-8f]|uniref:hypothetical protein n=1 Tax=Bacillus sp. V5-8f TaxID=2053044 RepID=UPI000C76BFE7|nr:hypothetical protein [Bacillus sp. V5-8f]PLT34418.1 hypothetical protein CUU64_09370 [Bacillus sp. V5-8f]
MKNIIFPSILFGILLLGGCSFGPNHNDQAERGNASEDIETMKPSHTPEGDNDGQSTGILDGVQKVLLTIKETEQMMERSAQTKTVNEFGSRLEEEWDTIEKTVEKRFPEDYISIEKSLYPLIAEMKKTTPDLAKVKNFSEQTKAKLEQFKGKVEK